MAIFKVEGGHRLHGSITPQVGRINEDQFPKSKSNSETEPTVFVIQSKSIYINSKINADFIHYILPELLDVAEDRNYIFIFTDVKKITDIEVNSVFNSSLKSIFVLDNIAEFASERGSKTVFGLLQLHCHRGPEAAVA